MAAKPIVIFVLGAPGSGKGTQSANIVKEFGFVHLSAGDLLRAERNTGSDISTVIEQYIKDGKIVPVEITVGLLEKAMNASSVQKFLIDGFPRNEDNLSGWQKTMDDKTDVRFVLFFECSKDVCVERCLERGKTSGRDDDNIASLEKRFVTYVDHTKPIIDQYDEKGMVRTINADVGIDQVFEDVKKVFKAEGF
ncbi:UMP-CMP kinase-like isoform X2 [Acanthaster planci]|nr:UMP-CMP kinase-like isoform X2 [Acanthaster planci]XP_022087761.1 UMP-CMP kinase-like isoform X2 [Acanthaster planci]XP_022087762.1 UMP-CMP kinase-like isoform X2 [Acanthaster planci]